MKIAIYNLLFISLFPSAMFQPRANTMAGRPLELQLVKAEDLSVAPWPVGGFELQPIQAKITVDTNIYMLLQANGIAPDPGAFSLIYDLNPGISDINAVKSDTQILLPAISDKDLVKLQGKKYLVEVTVDPDLRQELNKQIEVMQQFGSSIQLLTDEKIQTELKTLLGWYQQIEKRFKRKTDPPLRRPTLIELQTEASLLNSILQGISQDSKELNETDRQQVAAIYEDIKLEMVHYGQVLAGVAPKSQPFYPVTVMIKGVDPKLVSKLRVYYTYNGLFRPLPANPPVLSFPFTHLGSGSSENLLVKNYQIWAAKDGDSNHPLTAPFPLHISNSSPPSVTVELQALKAHP